MDNQQTPAASTRSSKEIPVEKPRWAFSKGTLIGAAIEVPAISFGVWMAQQVGIGDPAVGFLRMMWLTAIFAGIAALFTAGGIGRLAASVTAERGRPRAIFQAARAHAIAGAGLTLIATIPHGGLPIEIKDWIVLGLIGLLPGAACGAVIGFVCSSASPVGLADVWSLTVSRPSGALRQLLDPKDLVKLGGVLRSRTSGFFEGIFDPAPRPPEKPVEEPKPDDKPADKGSGSA
jgi:hypothetical protein